MTSILPNPHIEPSNDRELPEKVASPSANQDIDAVYRYLDAAVYGNTDKVRQMIASSEFAGLSQEEQMEVMLGIQRIGEDFQATVQRVIARFTVLASPMVDKLKAEILITALESIDFGVDELSRRKIINCLNRVGIRFVNQLVWVDQQNVLQIIDLDKIKRLGSQSQLLVGNYLRRNLPVGKTLSQEELDLLA